MNEFIEDITEFHQKFNLLSPARPTMLTGNLHAFRVGFLKEEVIEFQHAETLQDALDALVDIVYVALGTAYLMNLPFEEGWNEVHKTNMTKVRAEKAADSLRGSTFDVVKPDGWTPPNLKDVIQKYVNSLARTDGLSSNG